MSPGYAIVTRGLTKIYRGRFSGREVRAVDGVSIEVGKGTTFGLLGPNGAGKTTFIKMVLSAARPTSGAAYVFGMDSGKPEARRAIGYLPENHRFPTYMTGRGMLDFCAALSGVNAASRKKRIGELLGLVGLENWADTRLRKYSKGMLQRLGLAQALLHEPRLLILDEPTDGVDPLGRRHIRDILNDLEDRGVTIFLNSHLLGEVETFCREVAIVHRGRIALHGSVRELTAGSGYCVAAERVPERLVEALRVEAARVSARNGSAEFIFAGRLEVNRAVDLLRAENCEIESIRRVGSTLEDVFLRTVNAQ
jgi:ABC-2 type transport system ATP-binding protein